MNVPPLVILHHIQKHYSLIIAASKNNKRRILQNKLSMIKTGPIVIVEDDQDDCDLFTDAIKDLRIENEVLCFSNGLDALNYLTETRDLPFLIFCDISMPVMDGLELKRRIEKDEKLKRKSVPIIFFTTAATPQVAKEAYYLSAQGFFEKPVKYIDTLVLLKHIIDYWRFSKHPVR